MPLRYRSLMAICSCLRATHKVLCKYTQGQCCPLFSYPFNQQKSHNYLQHLQGSRPTLLLLEGLLLQLILHIIAKVCPTHSHDRVTSLFQTLPRVRIVLRINSKSLRTACKTLKDLALQQLEPHDLPLPDHQAALVIWFPLFF